MQRFSFWPTARRLLVEAPLLACAGAAGILAPFLIPGPFRFSGFVRRKGTAEWIFALAALAALVVNPTPFPYNLIHLVPALFLLVMAFLHPALAALTPQGRRVIVACLLLLHGATWALATSRHLDMDNDRQLRVIRLAESMTDPALHRVFDGSGLVSTRDPIGVNWLVHMLTIDNFSNGIWPTLQASLAANPTPVLLPNYRFEMLPKADKDFIGAHYQALATDFMVLGGIWEAETVRWNALATGRYDIRFQAAKPGDPAQLTLDGAAIPGGLQILTKGEHLFQTSPGVRIQVIWLGPNLSALPQLEQTRKQLFVNWY